MNSLTLKKPSNSALGRPREFNEEAVLAAAAQAFWKNGYHATSIENLSEATGLLRGSLYSAYRDKKGILLAALAHYSKGRIARLAKSLTSKHPGQEVLREALLYYIETASDLDRMRACFITNTALELTPQDRKVAELVERVFRQMAMLWTGAVRRARAESFFKGSLDEQTAGDYLLCFVQGLRVMGKIYNRQELTAIVDMALSGLRLTDEKKSS